MTLGSFSFLQHEGDELACPALVVLMLAAVCLAAPSIGCGQTTIKVDVTQVLMPVVVTDKAGHHVNGLKAADFHLHEDGVEQDIVGFATSWTGTERIKRSEASLSPSEAVLPSKPSAATSSPSALTSFALIRYIPRFRVSTECGRRSESFLPKKKLAIRNMH